MDKSGTRTNGVNSGSRASNWNNYPWNSNWNIGLRAALLRQIHYEVKGTSSSETSKDGLAFYG